MWPTSAAASVALLVVLGLKKGLDGKISARGRYGLSLLVVARFLLPFTPESSFSVEGLVARPERVVAVTPVAIEATTEVATKSVGVVSLGEVAKGSIDWKRLAIWIWFGGMLSLVVFALAQQARFAWRVRRMERCSELAWLKLLKEGCGKLGVRRGVELRVTEEYERPLLFGWARPTIILPRWLMQEPAGKIEAVILHELAHVRRHDVLFNWVLVGMRALHWMNPLAWLAVKDCLGERELVRDEMALAALGVERRGDYGETLLELAARRGGGTPAAASTMIGYSQIKRRIKMITEKKQRRVLVGSMVLLVAAGTVLVTFTRAAENELPNEKVYSDLTKQAGRKEERKPSRQEEGLAMLKDEVMKQEQKINSLQKEISKLRQEQAIVDLELLSERGKLLTRQMAEVDDQKRGLETRLQMVKGLREKGDYEALSSFLEDGSLSMVILEVYRQQQNLERVRRDYADEHPEVRSATEMMAATERRMEKRVKGIETGLETKIQVLQEQAKMVEESLAQVRAQRADQEDRALPLQVLARQLETETRVAEALRMRWIQEIVDTRIPKEKQLLN